MKTQSITNIIFFLLCINIGMAQNLEKTKDNSDEIRYELRVELSKEDINKKHAFEIPKNISSITSGIEGKVSNGVLKIYLMDPNKRSEGLFSLNASSSKKKGREHKGEAKGHFENENNRPLPGTWWLHVDGDEVEGQFTVEIVLSK
ncbi:MAG: hypothetical protein R3213_04590 [Flavobacteriaceae bacterium]|nr:hypothetical protein [Flavobacteriaceae bacterium]